MGVLSLSCYVKTHSIVNHVCHLVMAVAVVLVKLALTVDGSEHGFGFVCDLLSKQVLDDSEQKKGLDWRGGHFNLFKTVITFCELLLWHYCVLGAG